MLRSNEVTSRILDHLRRKHSAENGRKLRRRRVRVAILDFVLSRAMDAGIIPPAEDAPERDWEEFFKNLIEFLDALAEILTRLFGMFPTDAD